MKKSGRSDVNKSTKKLSLYLVPVWPAFELKQFDRFCCFSRILAHCLQWNQCLKCFQIYIRYFLCVIGSVKKNVLKTFIYSDWCDKVLRNFAVKLCGTHKNYKSFQNIWIKVSCATMLWLIKGWYTEITQTQNDSRIWWGSLGLQMITMNWTASTLVFHWRDESLKIN